MNYIMNNINSMLSAIECKVIMIYGMYKKYKVKQENQAPILITELIQTDTY